MFDGEDVPSLDAIFSAIASSRARNEQSREKRATAKPPRGNGPAQATRAYVALPPPHIVVPRTHDADAFREQALRQALARGHRDVGGLPWWAWEIAQRCHRGLWRSEIRRLPREVSLRLQKAAELGRTEAAKRSIAAVGCVICWISLRNPRACGRPQNVGGVSGASIQALTRNARGEPYSLSAVQHANHRGAGPGSPELGTAGFLEHLRQSGCIKSWIPPASQVPSFMLGNGYAFAVFRVRLDHDHEERLQALAEALAGPP